MKSLKRFDEFEWYNFAKFLASMVDAKTDYYRLKALNMFKECLIPFENYMKNRNENLAFPDFITCSMMARMYAITGNMNKANQLFQTAYTTAESIEYDSPRFKAMGLIIRANQIESCLRNNQKDYYSLICQLKEKYYDYVNNSYIYNSMKKPFWKWEIYLQYERLNSLNNKEIGNQDIIDFNKMYNTIIL